MVKISLHTANGMLHILKKCPKMKQYKVIDGRNRYRNDTNCRIIKDNDNHFVVEKSETDSQGPCVRRVIILILNARKFQLERIVGESEAILLKLKGVQLEEVNE